MVEYKKSEVLLENNKYKQEKVTVQEEKLMVKNGKDK